MKLLCYLTSLTLLVTVQTQIPNEAISEIEKKCQNEIGVSQEVLNRAHNGDWGDDPKLKEQMLCMFKKFGLATESGEMVVDLWRSLLKQLGINDEEVESIVNECVVKKDTPEETAFNTAKCVDKKKRVD
ncbi:hypothetical protein MTP99_000191 [Tenebrio molitor]|nr:hypothetical protein MTP99_000191 [Tenebrio molitor]CAH1363857.1 unnamed protein product [Tenebrio molitor]